jgi:hypothetical protein
MRREVFEKALKCFCSKAKIEEYNTWDRSRLDENNKWVKDSPALFVVINFEKTETENLTCNKLSQQLSDLLGHEIMIEKSSDLNYLD